MKDCKSIFLKLYHLIELLELVNTNNLSSYFPLKFDENESKKKKN